VKYGNHPARLKAQEEGNTHFLADCQHHGEWSKHYVSSGRCVACTAAAKEPSKQAQYWAENKEWINAKRRQS
jgi:hypothetical protein